MMTLTIDTKVYPLEAIQAATYSMTDRVYARMVRKGAEVSVTLKPKGAGGNGGRELEDEFFNELLHQTLRLRVSENNQKIREYIVTKALVSAQVPGLVPEVQAPAGGPDPDCPECAAEAKARQSFPQSSKDAGRPEAGQPRQDQPQAPPVDAELEKEIEKLLAEIEKAEPSSDDPLGVAVPWEQKHGPAAGGAAKVKAAKVKAAKTKGGKKAS
ncbi:MAG: His-Xaa-Ser system protein HxsD [Elusimicrobia bacterium]|nr:His-Xaa-Ser system protein HxsD [Elusimicrobiota bacterium]